MYTSTSYSLALTFALLGASAAPLSTSDGLSILVGNDDGCMLRTWNAG
jgi:hypothetical protein